MLFFLCSFCVFVFFFFKQKTAYEMRISDWSSDVCSSDLRRHRADIHGEGRHVQQVVEDARDFREQHADVLAARRCGDAEQPLDGEHKGVLLTQDRKSVVEGKSVSVRLDLGGRRIIKKKNILKTSQKKQKTPEKINT